MNPTGTIVPTSTAMLYMPRCVGEGGGGECVRVRADAREHEALRAVACHAVPVRARVRASACTPAHTDTHHVCAHERNGMPKERSTPAGSFGLHWANKSLSNESPLHQSAQRNDPIPEDDPFLSTVRIPPSLCMAPLIASFDYVDGVDVRMV